MTNDQEIIAKIRKILDEEKVFLIPSAEIRDADDFVELGIDSVQLVTFLTAVEIAFAFDIPPDDFMIENFINIETVAKYIKEKISELNK